MVRDIVKHITEDGLNRLKCKYNKDIIIQKQRCEICEITDQKDEKNIKIAGTTE
ncbi:hypothetical protein ACV3R2_14920 [Clostridium perfringens]|uniref:hypothetical protein n=1 Tax=Clostridium perfringens TaxID=1502 RepID=UPI0029049753|nr:hypothetical protein [Clostridium perfringens]MDU3019902.1 hypothetical protein [Clostridium perfringens]